MSSNAQHTCDNGSSTNEEQSTIDSLHKRRFDAKPGLPETLTVSTPVSGVSGPPSSATRGTPSPRLTPEEEAIDATVVCDAMLQRLEGYNDPLSVRTREAALDARAVVEALDHLDKLNEVMAQLVELKEQIDRRTRRARDATMLADMAALHRRVAAQMERAQLEQRELELHNEALDADLDPEFAYTEALLESMLAAGRGASMKRAGSRWKARNLRGSLLRKQRSRSVGGEDSEGVGAGEARLSVPAAPRQRRSAEECRKVDKSKISKWTKVKAAFKWEKAHQGVASGAAGVVGVAGALAGAVALSGSSPTTPVTPAPPHQAAHPTDESACVTPGSLVSLTPNSSCEELRMDSGPSRRSGHMRCDENDNTYLQAPTLDDSSTSPSPNKLHKTPWSKMRDIIQTRKESVRRKQRSTRSAGAAASSRRRSFSDGGESDVPPALTLTIPSSEELDPEAEPAEHLALRKQRSLELGAAGASGGRPPAGRRGESRASKWSKVKKAFLTSASASVPSSPNRHSAFFTDVETEGVSSGCEAGVRDEIQRDYAALQSRLRREFSDKRDKLYAGRPVATEDQLSADFRKKLAEWQRMKSGPRARQPPPVPDRSDLSEDFLKKWDAWNHLKETNSVPAWAEEARPDEVLVQTSTGFFRFQGISRSFTRKLHEWEKARGIAPEASTSALLRAAQGAQGSKRRATSGSLPPAPLARAQSAGSVVAPSSSTPSVHVHGSSLSVNDADKLEIDYEHDNQSEGACGDYLGEEGSSNEAEGRGAVLVVVEAEEVCTAAPLMVVSPRHTPQKPVYTYDHDEPARLLCETSSAAAVVQQESMTTRDPENRIVGDQTKEKRSTTSSQLFGQRNTDKPKERRPLFRQPSIEDDAQFIRRTIEEIERGSSNRVNIQDGQSPLAWRRAHRGSPEKFSRENIESSASSPHRALANYSQNSDEDKFHRKSLSSKSYTEQSSKSKDCESDELTRRKDLEKGSNGKKKLKARARLEREASKPSESDSEPEVDTVTVEIPRRRKRPRRPSERPKTPPPSASAASDTEEQVYVLKLQATEEMQGSPEIIVKTKRKIFSPVVRSGEVTPRAVIPLDVEELEEVGPRGISFDDRHIKPNGENIVEAKVKVSRDLSRKSQDDLAETRSRLQLALEDFESAEDKIPTSRPPLPSSPSAQRRPPPKETAPSIRIMIQRYNLKINEDGHTSPASSGTTSPAWRSPAAERRRPPDMPARVTIKNNPFVEREVQKSASACQLSRREATSSERRLEIPPQTQDGGVLKSHSACTLHPEGKRRLSSSPTPLREEPEITIPVGAEASITSNSQSSLETPASASVSRHNPFDATLSDRRLNAPKSVNRPSVERLISSTSTGSVSRVSLERIMSGMSQERRESLERMISRASVDAPMESTSKEPMTPSERSQRIRAARERFLSSPGPIRRDLSGSAGELRPGDRLNRASCSSDLSYEDGGAPGELGRSASTGMVNVDRNAWQRVQAGGAESGARRSSRRRGGGGGGSSSGGKFSLSRLTARLRRRQDRDTGGGAVSRLCRQSLLVQLRPEQS